MFGENPLFYDWFGLIFENEFLICYIARGEPPRRRSGAGPSVGGEAAELAVDDADGERAGATVAGPSVGGEAAKVADVAAPPPEWRGASCGPVEAALGDGPARAHALSASEVSGAGERRRHPWVGNQPKASAAQRE